MKKKEKREGKREKFIPALLDNPGEAANQLDAFLHFIHRHYSDSGTIQITPTLKSFLIHRTEVVFTSDVELVTLQKKPESHSLQILTPPVPKDEEEKRVLYLLNQCGDLIIKCQKQAYEQVREMLLGMLDENGMELMVEEFLTFKNEQMNK